MPSSKRDFELYAEWHTAQAPKPNKDPEATRAIQLPCPDGPGSE